MPSSFVFQQNFGNESRNSLGPLKAKTF